MIDERDELIERVAQALSPLPPKNAHAKAQILAAVRANRARAPQPWTLVFEWMRQPTFSVTSAGLLAAAALAIGFVARGSLQTLGQPDGALDAARPNPVSVTAIPAANTPGIVRAVPIEITFDAAGAKNVSIVGDFNEWDSTAAPLTRFGANGPWTVTVKVMPGRHLYAFMVDGNLVVDPKAPHTHDLDFGGEASVLMVNTP
jgi:Glycogen recognition site of AMP-activated protein kinase